MFVADERNQTATIDWIHEALIKSREWEDRTKETRRIKQHNPSRLKKCSGAWQTIMKGSQSYKKKKKNSLKMVQWKSLWTPTLHRRMHIADGGCTVWELKWCYCAVSGIGSGPLWCCSSRPHLQRSHARDELLLRRLRSCVSSTLVPSQLPRPPLIPLRTEALAGSYREEII